MTTVETSPSSPAASASASPRIALPPFVPASPEEIARRRALFAKVMALREQIGPIGIRSDDLVHQARVEADGVDE